ncbi:hypothetical protein CKA32_001237 [Geitlerinema sp. FC II]|nr:hypothetical protein CKA32_001237 [Geitlerinema sp. FC II]
MVRDDRSGDFIPDFSSHAPLYVGGVHWRCASFREELRV